MAVDQITYKKLWDAFSEHNPRLASKTLELAQKILEMDRIDSDGIKKAVESQEMLDLIGLVESNSEAFYELAIFRPEPKELLKAIDIFAAELILSNER